MIERESRNASSELQSRADGRRNRSHRPRPWVFPPPSVDQARCARTHSGRRQPGKPTRTAYVLVSGMGLG